MFEIGRINRDQIDLEMLSQEYFLTYLLLVVRIANQAEILDEYVLNLPVSTSATSWVQLRLPSQSPVFTLRIQKDTQRRVAANTE